MPREYCSCIRLQPKRKRVSPIGSPTNSITEYWGAVKELNSSYYNGGPISVTMCPPDGNSSQVPLQQPRINYCVAVKELKLSYHNGYIYSK